jgi:hypothetical protein
MKAPITSPKSRAFALLVGVTLGVPGCATFSGMSWEERDQANKDLAKESSYWQSLKPERSLLDNREIPVNGR